MNLYLSRLLLNPTSRQVQSEIFSPYEMHRTIMRAFPESGEDPRNRHDVLFRVDQGLRNGCLLLYVQSSTQPNWRFLEEKERYLDHSSQLPAASCREILPLLRALTPGRVLSFRLRANPTRRVWNKEDPLHGKRVGLFKEKDQVEWLLRKGRERIPGIPGGFEVLTKDGYDSSDNAPTLLRLAVNPEGMVYGRKRGQGEGHAMKHHSVVFEGQLRVTDPEFFVQTMRQGIGAGKAFGFGLLTLAPTSHDRRVVS